ncbi:30S ribosomal protein S21, partial [Candidatus Gottesmanbacteria bacterium]|nr:30S ribosomal protein S21 [Candidatus Gottesmanbacteria bacterium]
SLIRKFIRKVLNDGLLNDLKKHEFYQKPAEMRKIARQELKRRMKRNRHN